MNIPGAAPRRLKRYAQFIQDGEFHAQLDAIHTGLVVALNIKVAGVAESDQADVETYDENVDQDEMMEHATVRCGIIVQWGDFLQVNARFADIQQ